MRRFAAVIALCGVAACNPKDTDGTKVWLREPRLSRCCPEPPTNVDGCDPTVETHDKAAQIIAFQPDCIDDAIDALTPLAKADARAFTDLIAAHIVRGRHNGRPSDLLNALVMSDEAEELRPRDPVVVFNRALLQEELGFATAAAASWNRALHLDGAEPWTSLARGHFERLARESRYDPVRAWSQAHARLLVALQERDRAEVARVIQPFPWEAEQVLLQQLLPNGDFDAAAILASSLRDRTGDAFLVDVVRAIGRTRDGPALQNAFRAFADARRLEWALYRRESPAAYARAAALLHAARSPLAILADAYAYRFDLTRLEPLQKSPYASVRARVATARAFVYEFDKRFMPALDALAVAEAEYASVHNEQGLALTRSNRATVLAEIGQYDDACTDALRAVRALPRIADVQWRHRILGDAATAVLKGGRDAALVALEYQNTAIRELRRATARARPDDADFLRKLRINIASALRKRAEIEVALGRSADAQADLQEAVRVAVDQEESTKRDLLSRLRAVEGQLLLSEGRYHAAAAAFDEALRLTQDLVFHATLRHHRAEALLAANKDAEGEAELRRALQLVREEQGAALSLRSPSQEFLWSSYFSVFQDAYRRLIDRLAGSGRIEEAFHYAETSRALEPLDLLRRLPSLPPSFRRMTNDGERLDLAAFRQRLEPGTSLLEYCVLEDRTYVWIVSRDRFELVRLDTGRLAVEEWADQVRRAVRRGKPTALDTVLLAAHSNLVKPVLARIGTAPQRIVFIPDGAMHALPFGALRDSVTRRYLIQDSVIEIAGSASLYLFSRLQDEALPRSERPPVLLVGEPALDRGSRLTRVLSPLPHALEEVAAIRACCAPQATVLTGAQATVPAFLDAARRSAVVHVAGHALANKDVPTLSMLVLAPSRQHNGILDAQELLATLKLDRTRLVVFSACHSADGSLIGPEGVAPLVRPLIAAGAPAVIGSLWDVEDATASRLLVSFHRAYWQGSDAATAMQAAQTELLGSSPVSAWATFQVIGHASSPATLPH